MRLYRNMQLYLGNEDNDILEAINKHASDNDRSLSWAARDLIRRGMRVVEVPLIRDLRAEYERRQNEDIT